MLPQLVFVAAMVFAFLFVSRWVLLEVARVERQISRLQRILQRVGRNRVTSLQFDAATGLYLPAKY